MPEAPRKTSAALESSRALGRILERVKNNVLLSAEFENVVVLSDEFFEEITSHPIPTDLAAVRVLAPSPAVLDLFMWLSYRCFSAKGEESIPIFGNFGLAAQLGNVEYDETHIKHPRYSA
jgi:hypothetical protein